MSSMTIDRIRIETQEEADVVPHGSVVVGGVVSPYDRPIPGKDVLTHVAIPVAQAIEARRVLRDGANYFASDNACELADEHCRIADLILSPALAEAAEQQAIPDWLDARLARLLGSLDDDEWTALRAHAKGFIEYAAALDAEGRQG